MNNIEPLIHKGELKLAWQKIQTYIKEHPNDPQGIILVSKVQVKAGLINKAIFTIEHAINHDISYSNAKDDLQAFLIHLYVSNYNFEKAESAVNTLKTDMLTIADSYIYIANALAKCEKHLESLNYYKLGLNLYPENLELLEGAANLEMISGNFINAEKYLNSALSIQPNNGRYIWLYSDIAKTFKNNKVKTLYVKFSRYFNAQGASINHSVYWHYALGNFALNLKIYKEAVEHYKLGAQIRRSEFDNYSVDEELNWLAQVSQFQSQLPQLTIDSNQNSVIPIFIIGMPRSGTTLLATLLSKYENIQDLGELPLMQSLAQQLSSNAISLKQVRNIYLSEINKKANNYPYVIDQLPTNFININLIKAALPEAKIILVNRDINDIFISNLFFLFAPNSMPFTYNETELLKFIQQFERIKKDVGSGSTLNYEDLVHDTEDTITSFIAKQKINAGYKVKKTSYIATGSSVEARKEIYTTSVKKWQKFAPYFSKILPIQVNHGNS